MEKIYNIVAFPLARKYGLPIIDCTRAFDIDDNTLYSNQIMSSHKGSELITEMVTHVMQKHQF